MFQGCLSIEIWNEEKTECAFVSKMVKLPFMPSDAIGLKFHVGTFYFTEILWDTTSHMFEATAHVVAGWDSESYLDVTYYLDGFRRDEWNVIQPRPLPWKR